MHKSINKSVILYVAIALVIHFVLTITCIRANAPTCDEIAHHVASGYSYIATGDFRMNPANPPLIREISALPLCFLNLKASFDSQSWKEGNSPVFGREFFYSANKNADRIIFWARIPIAVLSVILGLLVFMWSSSLYGYKGGMLSLAIYSFSPNIIAHASLATVDLGATLFIFAAVFSFWVFLKRQSVFSIVLAGVAFGLALASKYTSIFLIPVFVLLAMQNGGFFKKVRNIAIICMIGAATLFASYFFEIKPLIKNAPDIPEKIEYIKKFVDKARLENIGLTKERAIWIAKELPVPFSAYLIGLAGVIHQNSIGGYHTFLLGKVSEAGFWNYFIIAFLAKSTIPVLILFISAIAFLFTANGSRIRDELFLLVPIVIFFAVLFSNKAQVGIRHLLPIYPFIFVLIGSLSAIHMKNIFKYGLFSIAVIWQIASLFTVFPYPIAYFNEAVGGPDNGYKILRDSNLDWGQGLKALGEYVEKNGIEKIKLYYFGTADPSYYNIPFNVMGEADFKEPGSGVYAISAQYLDSVPWARGREPVAKIAYSIFVYRI